MHNLRNHELLVLGPGKLRGHLLVFDLGTRSGFRLLQQTLDHGMKRVQRRQLGTFLIRRQHGAETVGGREYEFRQIPAMRFCNLRSEYVFEFVRQLAELVKSTGCRIALQRVNHAANAANHVLVGRARLEFQAGLIQRLQQLGGTLKKERTQFAVAFVGWTVHGLASIRWYAVPLFSCTMRNFWVRPKRLSAWPTNRKPPGFKQCQNFSIKRFCSASSK